MMAAIQQNQLLFNLDVPAMPINMVAQYPRPEAIVIEKFGTCSGPLITAPKQAFQLSAVSEESLSQAVQLARRDLKKEKEKKLEAAEKHGKATGKTAANKDAKKGRTEIIRSSHYNERLKKREERKKQERDRVLLMKEREKGWKARTMTTQTGRTLSHMPASSMSPPTRDVGPDLTQLSGDARVLAEIRKLRLDMDACLNKIHQIHEAAKRDPTAWRPEPPVYAEDIEAERKRVMRREEQETRSLRTIYQLTQQVRVLQEEMNRLGQCIVKRDKKSQILSRLAAIHRGTVRALQTFIQHITDYDLSHGLPRSYHELGLLVRQLSLCCVQLEVAGESQVPDNVMTLLKDYAEINKILDIPTSPKSPPRLCQVSKPAQNTKKQSPASRKLDFSALSETNRRTTQGPIIIDKLEKEATGRAADVTPEREAALRSAISILMRKPSAANASPVLQRQQKVPLPHTEQPTTRRTARGVAWDYPLEKPKLQQFKAGTRKGLLLPTRSRAQRRKVPKTHVQPPGETHYAEPTLSSRLKTVPPEERVLTSPQQSIRQPYPDTAGISKKRSSSAPASPRSPQQTGTNYHSSSLCSSPRSPSSYGSPRQISGYPHSSPFISPGSRRDIIKQVQRDRENVLKRKEKAKINMLRQKLGQPEEWVKKAEEKIKEKLQPILDRAQEILDAYRSMRQLEYQQHKQQQHQQQEHLHVSSADTAVNAKSVDINADLLADSLLGELLEDTIHEINYIDTDTRAEHQAAVMLNMPSVETMVQRLQEMEKEQQEIRRRWATLVYEEENSAIPARARYFDAPLSERPSTPTPIHVTSHLPDVEQTFLPDSVLARLESNPSDERAILFTKPVQQIVPKTSLHFSRPDGSLHLQPEHTQRKPGIHIALSQEMIQSIESHKKSYEQYLKKNSYQAIGRFNPWLIVEEVANEILDDCLTDVAKELEDINSDIVNNVYSGEFNKVPSPSDPKPSSSLHHDYNDYSRKNSAIGTTKEHNLMDSEREARHSEASQSSKRSSIQKARAVLSDYQSPSPESVSGNYSYEDDFVESSLRSRSQESGSKSDK